MTRTVWLTRRYAIKVPGGLGGYRPSALVRGWLANRSEWKQRLRKDALTPRWTLAHVVLVFPRVDTFTREQEDWWEERIRPELTTYGYSDEESKLTSWGYKAATKDGYQGMVLIDFDRAWQPPRGLVGGLYYGNQERLARKWAKL